MLSSASLSFVGDVQSPLRPGGTAGLNLMNLVTACEETMVRQDSDFRFESNNKGKNERPEEIGRRMRQLPSGLLDGHVNLVSIKQVDGPTPTAR